LDAYQKELFDCYEQMRKSCKSYMAGSHPESPEKTHKIDRHKVAAVLTKSKINTIGQESECTDVASFFLEWIENRATQ